MPVSPKRSEPKLYWESDCKRATVYLGDCREVMERMECDQFHAVVTDPPYGLGFMGKEWDAPWKSVEAARKYLRHNVRDSQGFQQWFHARAEAMLRASKPGAYLLSFGGTRMWHRMACAAEDAGWEVRDTVMWVYGSGFPKGLDISKAVDSTLGEERTEVVGPGLAPIVQGQFNARDIGAGGYGYKSEYEITVPASDDRRRWQGWNTALKPAVEPIILARRPMAGSVAENVLENGCGGINVDGCRVGTTGADVTRQIQSYSCSGSGVYQFNSGEAGSQSMRGGFNKTHKDGKWPTNFIHDGSEEAVTPLPDGAARYFYSAKANESDRSATSDTLHPTVKPLNLMRYLVRLVAHKGATVLDPFMGSGTTGCACIAEGVYFVGIEQSREYADLAIDRLREHLGEHEKVERLKTGKRVTKSQPPPFEGM